MTPSLSLLQDVLTPLDDYVNRPDPFYSWEEVETIDGPGYTLHVLNMTSQKWMDGSFIIVLISAFYLKITKFLRLHVFSNISLLFIVFV